MTTPGGHLHLLLLLPPGSPPRGVPLSLESACAGVRLRAFNHHQADLELRTCRPPQGARVCLSRSETAQLPFWPPWALRLPSLLRKVRAPPPGRPAHTPASPTLYLSHTMPFSLLLQHGLHHNWPTGRLGRSRPADMFCLAEHSASKEFDLVANFKKSDFT